VATSSTKSTTLAVRRIVTIPLGGNDRPGAPGQDMRSPSIPDRHERDQRRADCIMDRRGRRHIRHTPKDNATRAGSRSTTLPGRT
jgi:hypothetical protein